MLIMEPSYNTILLLLWSLNECYCYIMYIKANIQILHRTDET